MRRLMYFLVSIILLVMMAGLALAQQPQQSQQNFIIYPSKGQSPQQLEQDKFECYDWAKQQTGFDPMQMPTASTPPPPGPQGSTAGGAVKGAAGGALLGLGIGAIAGDAGKGAAIGAVSGGVFGGMRSRNRIEQEQQAQQQWTDQQTSQYMQKRNYYNRAYSACLTGRGYTVE